MKALHEINESNKDDLLAQFAIMTDKKVEDKQ